MAQYVESGQLLFIYWPIVDFGAGSLNAYAAAHCIGLQNSDAFWAAHDLFFAEQGEVWQATSEYFVNAAASVGVDPEAFRSCYDSGEGHGIGTLLDSQRREAGITNRPTFDINGQRLFGNQPFGAFAQAIEAVLNG